MFVCQTLKASHLLMISCFLNAEKVLRMAPYLFEPEHAVEESSYQSENALISKASFVCTDILSS